jgi:hypothetical protein
MVCTKRKVSFQPIDNLEVRKYLKNIIDWEGNHIHWRSWRRIGWKRSGSKRPRSDKLATNDISERRKVKKGKRWGWGSGSQWISGNFANQNQYKRPISDHLSTSLTLTLYMYTSIRYMPGANTINGYEMGTRSRSALVRMMGRYLHPAKNNDQALHQNFTPLNLILLNHLKAWDKNFKYTWKFS